MNRRITSAILAAVLVLTTPLCVFADEPKEEIKTGTQENRKELKKDKEEELRENDEFIEEDEEDTVEESVTEWEIFEINSTADLVAFSRLCWLDTWSRDKKVLLNCDLSLVNSNFTPIPTFGGYFDGQGHTIDGLYLYDSASYVGLFSQLQENGVIINLNVVGNVVPTGKQMIVGGIVADNFGEIRNCTFKGLLEGNDYTGGITGYNELSGNIVDCESKGYFLGMHFTGGIAGENLGNISRCKNEADINTRAKDETISMSELSLDAYSKSLFKIVEEDNDKEKNIDISTSCSDTGGIAGMSIGVIQNCVNEGTIGYEHVGYNTGGIVGRQSGYLNKCSNNGNIFGRKDIGGIVGQAEPYVVVDFSQDIVRQLSENIEKLHDIISVTLKDAGGSSDTISSRLSVIQNFTDKALDDTSVLADKTVEWTDGLANTANEAMSRIDYIMDEAAKKDGIFDQTRNAAKNVKKSTEELSELADDVNIYNYMNEEETALYDSNKQELKDITSQYTENAGKATKAYSNYYFDQTRRDTDKYYFDEGVTEKDLRPVNENGEIVDVNYDEGYQSYIDKGIVKWVHVDEEGNQTEFPQTEGEQGELDQKLVRDAESALTENAATIEQGADQYARDKHAENHNGHSYTQDLTESADIISGIILANAGDMSDDAREDAKQSAEYIKESASNMEKGMDSAKGILDNINSRSDLALPKLGDDYRNTTNSLIGNLKNMTENMGYLNNEMADATDVLLSDLEGVNDQFNTIMLLYTDAIDGVLEADYTASYEDNSLEVAMESTDAAVVECQNNASIQGDIDVAGICGSMGIEYDFDLESDVTGSKDAKVNSTYETKCILRKNKNRGIIDGAKSNIGGICGLQEMGTIIICENYGRISSDEGENVGGVSGQSLSYIQKSYAKCSIFGKKNVGGIVGQGMHINDCRSMVKIYEADSYYGAIAGKVNEDGKIHRNYFVNTNLAGIDRISYSKKAEPMTFENFQNIEGLPDDFRYLTIDFYSDDKLVHSVRKNFGENYSESDIPSIPNQEGQYVVWNNTDFGPLKYDLDVEAEYVNFVTTIAGSKLRDRLQSIVLVDGEFNEKDELEDTLLNSEAVPLKDTIESFRIVVPDDGNMDHMFRYGAPDNFKDIEVFVKSGNDWKKTTTGTMGKYFTFRASGNEVEFAVTGKEIKSYKKLFMIVGGGVLSIIVLCVLIKGISMGKKSRRAKRNAKAILKKAKNDKKHNSHNSDKMQTSNKRDIEIIEIEDDTVKE